MKPGRNDPCSCGSGKKYKNCCLGKAEFKPSYSSSAPTSDEINLLGALFNTGRHVEQESLARSLLKLYPDSGVVWKLFGLSLQMQRKDALHAMQKAADLLPNDAEAHGNLAAALRARGQLDAAVASGRRALQIRPDFAEAHNNLGVALQGLGQLDAAVASYLRALEIKPDFIEVYNNLGGALKELGQLDDAAACYRGALQINPDFAEAHNNLGLVLKELGQFNDALTSFRRALELKPDFAEAHCNLGGYFTQVGQLDEAVASYRRALELKPDYIDAQSSLLFALNYTASHVPAYFLEEAYRYGRMVAERVTARFSAWQCAAKPGRLRVGMVSGDLRSHPVGFFLESLLAQLDHNRVELIAYPTVHKTDGVTARIKPYFAAWRPLAGLSDEAAARLIHADGVHILIDLAGHTAHNRLPVFAWKPAPVQAGWLGFFATTGVAEMDYLLADEVGVTEAQQEQFTEAIWYLPDTRLCFTAPEVDLPVASLPALANGMITFGCFQVLPKLGDGVLEAWGEILAALPDAKLRLQCSRLGEPAQVEQLLQRLQRYNIEPARVITHGSVEREDYLKAHAEVDIILDTFPYPGGTTTCEALWMGVPTLTLAGDSLLARQGASLLTAAGLEEWVAASKEEYITKAIALAGDMRKLATLRAGLRQQVLASPVFNAPRFARNFESALWGMWQSWCDQQQQEKG